MLMGLLLTGCSIQSRLSSHYKGKSFGVVMTDMGAPTQVEQLVGGGTLRTYVHKRMLAETPINTGQFQYDTFKSPKVMKSEWIRFKVDEQGIVREVTYSSEYGK